ncbi:MAG: RNA polymerase sigma factor [Bryobacteraceae bacterium]
MTGTLAGQLSARAHVGISIGQFGSWMASEQRRVFLLCRRMLQDTDEADSATQDVFLKAYRSICQSPEDAAELEFPEKWLTRIAVNTCLDRLRSKAWKLWRRRPSEADEKVILDMEADSHPDAERQLVSKQILLRLDQALGRLSARQRAVFTLRHFDSMPLEDIADVLQLDVGTVKAHLFRAVSKLRSELNDLYVPASSTRPPEAS